MSDSAEGWQSFEIMNGLGLIGTVISVYAFYLVAQVS